MFRRTALLQPPRSLCNSQLPTLVGGGSAFAFARGSISLPALRAPFQISFGLPGRESRGRGLLRVRLRGEVANTGVRGRVIRVEIRYCSSFQSKPPRALPSRL